MTAEMLQQHLKSGTTHLCQCWLLERQDGFRLGFTDHDQMITFAGNSFLPHHGLTAQALAETTGLSVNNSEAIGVLQSDAITEADINAGRYDNAVVTAWLVQWDAPDARQIKFRGTFGEMTRSSGGFQVELRGLTEALNSPTGHSYQRSCRAVLGDEECQFDVADPAYAVETKIAQRLNENVLIFESLPQFAPQWFDYGSIQMLSGNAAGLKGVIKADHVLAGDRREITLWLPLQAQVVVGDEVRLRAGCDKRLVTCRTKFDNLLNFRGFPNIPGEDWLVSVPRSGTPLDGGSLNG